MAVYGGSKSNSALSFAVERDNLLQCYDAFESTGSTHRPDVVGTYSGSRAEGNPVLNTTEGVGSNKIKYFTTSQCGHFSQISRNNIFHIYHKFYYSGLWHVKNKHKVWKFDDI